MSKKIDNKWQYVGDINIEYGGTYFDLSDWQYGYANAVRVTDLDSGCGFEGAVLIEKLTVLIDSPKHNQSAAQCCGFDLDELDLSDENDRLRLAEAVMSYGHYDPANEYYEPATEVVQTLDDGPMTFDGWAASRRVLTENLQGYVESKLD